MGSPDILNSVLPPANMSHRGDMPPFPSDALVRGKTVWFEGKFTIEVNLLPNQTICRMSPCSGLIANSSFQSWKVLPPPEHQSVLDGTAKVSSEKEKKHITRAAQTVKDGKTEGGKCKGSIISIISNFLPWVTLHLVSILRWTLNLLISKIASRAWLGILCYSSRPREKYCNEGYAE